MLYAAVIYIFPARMNKPNPAVPNPSPQGDSVQRVSIDN